MYTVKIEARADILGNVVDKITYKDIQASNRHEAGETAKALAHEENCQRYGMPVHFVAVSAKLN
jgi:hypothetical protein